ncbi:hypothetical protein GGR50DRAFT_688545 [Xylaria sp. CBS 124048]|nr:hypothetical protein GGR50DRAFT_688545 [Xylaria sp. CBS 124048]
MPHTHTHTPHVLIPDPALEQKLLETWNIFKNRRPPAYSPSPISPASFDESTLSQQSPLRNHHNTSRVIRVIRVICVIRAIRAIRAIRVISPIMGLPRGERESLLRPQPQSMRAPVEEENGGGHNRVLRSSWPVWRYVFLALVVLVVLLVTAFWAVVHFRIALRPLSPIDPDFGSSFLTSYCDGEQHRLKDQILALYFGESQNLAFQEVPRKHHASKPVNVGGQINVRRLTKGNGEPRMVLEIATNEPDLPVYTFIDADLQSMDVEVPEKYESTVPGQRPCVEMRGTIWVPEEAELGILHIEASHLDVLLFDDLSLRVVDHTKITSIVRHVEAGASKPITYAVDDEDEDENDDDDDDDDEDFVFLDIPSPSPDRDVFESAKNSWLFDSRITEVHTTSGDISGNWPLYDTLRLHTTSGNIKISITPMEDSDSHPQPAMLSIATVSGSISATEPIHEHSLIPRRDYLVDLKSISGKIQAALAFGTEAAVSTTASDMALELLPVINVDRLTPRNPAQLDTATTSGLTSVRVVEPLLFTTTRTPLAPRSDGDAGVSRALDCLEASHRSTSSDIGLRYPQSWEGLLYATTTGGRIVAGGKDLKILRYAGAWPGSQMEAQKGDGGVKSTIRVQTLLGSLDVIVGDER